jgi:hypothetical protein
MAIIIIEIENSLLSRIDSEVAKQKEKEKIQRSENKNVKQIISLTKQQKEIALKLCEEHGNATKANAYIKSLQKSVPSRMPSRTRLINQLLSMAMKGGAA